MPSFPPEVHAAFTSFGDVLRLRAAGMGNVPALVRIDGHGRRAETWTFADLDRRARAVAALLERKGLRGERALLMFEPGLDFVAAFFGCLYAGVVAIPAYPPDPSRLTRSLPRFVALVKDSGATTVVTTSMIAQLAGALVDYADGLEDLEAVAIDGVEDAEPGWTPPTLRRVHPAFIQYSSGSTSSPKGIVVTHGNLLDHALTLEALDHDAAGRSGLWWLPSYHDLGLIAGILQPVYYGVQTSLMSPIDFLKRPMAWLRAVSEMRPTHTGGPNFGYDLCVRKFDPAELEGVDLSSVTVWVNAAERVRKETIDRFVETFAPYGVTREAFGPAYGLAEATLVVSTNYGPREPVCLRVDPTALAEGRVEVVGEGVEAREAGGVGEVGEADGQWLVGVGAPGEVVDVAIVDPRSLRRAAPGHTGEIWVHTPSLADGYLDRSEQTTETFSAFLPGDGRSWLRTGDIGFLHEGELFVTARLKDLVIIRGRNHAPEDIERAVEEAHPAVRPGCVAAFSVEHDGEERLVVALETRSEGTVRQLVTDAVRMRLAEDGLRVWRVQLLERGAMPKTSSGKLQRHVARAAFAAQLEAETERVSQVRDWLVAQVTQKGDGAGVDMSRPILSYGIDSLEGVALIGDLEKVVGRELSARLVFDNPSLQVLAERVAAEAR